LLCLEVVNAARAKEMESVHAVLGCRERLKADCGDLYVRHTMRDDGIA
jgi:hypothetical protein